MLILVVQLTRCKTVQVRNYILYALRSPKVPPNPRFVILNWLLIINFSACISNIKHDMMVVYKNSNNIIRLCFETTFLP